MTQPLPGVLVGLTHDKNLMPIIREPRVLRVGIGVPKGRACYIYTHQGRWIIRYGEWVKDKLTNKDKLTMATAKGSDGKPGFQNRAEAEEYYAKNKANFAVSNRPQKIPFFTFTRRTIVETNGKPEEIFEPDFNAIEAHGDTPREIDIVFMGDNPFSGNYQAWSASELKCYGDGLNALRVIALGNDQWPGWKEAAAAKEKYFPVTECWVSGLCPYAKEVGHEKLVCKPNSTIAFQLANSIRLGATAYFSTTGIRSTQQLYSSLEIIKTIAGMAGAGIANTPLKLVLSPYRTNHNGIAATQYGVSLELRTQDVHRLKALLTESAWKPAPQRMIAPADEDIPIEVSPAAVTAEFYPEAQFDDDEPELKTEHPAESATNAKTDELAEKLKAKREAPAAQTAQSAPPTDTSTVANPTQELNHWPTRVTQAFLSVLGPERFKNVLMKTTGGAVAAWVNGANHKLVWDAMGAEKATMDAEKASAQSEPPPPADGELF